ncbi:protein SLOW GREEN 1 chloroplastic [Bienertia sinuspersici]
MASLTKLNYSQNPSPLSLRHRTPSFSTPISSISFKTQFSRPYPSSVSYKIRSSSNSAAMAINSKPSSNPKALNPILILKSPLTIAVAAAALFFTGLLGSNPLMARAEIASTPVAETSTQEEQEEGDKVSVEEREKKLEEVLGSNPDDVDVLKSLIEVKVKSKKLGEAVDVINRLIELEPEESEWPLLKCHMYSYLGEFRKAKLGFEEILAKEPLRAEAFHGLIMAVSQGESDSKELDEVRKRIEDAIARSIKEKREEEVRDLKLLIAQIRVIEGNYVEALQVYQELVKEEPRDFRPYLCQGIIYTLLKKKDEAQSSLISIRGLFLKAILMHSFLMIICLLLRYFHRWLRIMGV